VLASVKGETADRNVTLALEVTATGVTIHWETTDGSTTTYVDFFWLAIGPE